MLMIRLRRGGARHKPVYRVVVSDSRKATGADYLASLKEDAIFMQTQGVRAQSAGELLGFEYLKAAHEINPRATLASALDDSIPAPGLALEFERNLPASIEQRFRLGPLGRGWRHNYEISLNSLSETEIAILGPGDGERRFVNHAGSGWKELVEY